jgi:hypothetical protein
MSKYVGDFSKNDTITFMFTTFRPSTGAPFLLGGTPVVSVYKDNNTIQDTAGVTLTTNYDGVTGLNFVSINTTGTFYVDSSSYECVITTGTVDSVSVVGSCVGRFTMRDQAYLYPTTAGRTLDASASGQVIVSTNNDKSNYSLATAPLTSTQTADAVWNALLASYTTANTFGLRIVRTLSSSTTNEVTIGGSNHIAANVHAMQNNVITSAVIQDDAITGNELATSATHKIADGILSRKLAMNGNISDVAVTSISSATFTGNNTYTAGDTVQFVTSAPTSFTVSTKYYVISTSLTSTTFQLSASLGGSAITTSSTGAFTVVPIEDRTVRSSLRYLRNKVAANTATMNVYQEDDTALSWTSAITADASAAPITISDPT